MMSSAEVVDRGPTLDRARQAPAAAAHIDHALSVAKTEMHEDIGFDASHAFVVAARAALHGAVEIML